MASSLPSPSSLVTSLPLFLHFLLLLSFFPSSHSATYFTPECGDDLYPASNSVTQPCLTAQSSPWAARAFAYTFEWSGALWIAGGYQERSGPPTPLLDVWASYDLGRSWLQRANLTSPCSTSSTPGLVYGGALYLFCSGYSVLAGQQTHGGVGGQVTLTSQDRRLLTPWQSVTDGLNGRVGYSVNVLAVPFDGTGTAVLLNGAQLGGTGLQNDVWTFSTTGYTAATRTAQPAFSPANVFTQFMDKTGSGVYMAPWQPRVDHSTTTDSEGLVIIMTGGLTLTGGITGQVLNDVWQLSWMNDTVNPQVYQLNAGVNNFSSRKNAALYMVHDFLFLYAGSQDAAAVAVTQTFSYGLSLDDVWQSVDYGTSWVLLNATGTGTARHGVTPVEVSRRYFVLGGSDGSQTLNPQEAYLNDVFVAYW